MKNTHITYNGETKKIAVGDTKNPIFRGGAKVSLDEFSTYLDLESRKDCWSDLSFEINRLLDKELKDRKENLVQYKVKFDREDIDENLLEDFFHEIDDSEFRDECLDLIIDYRENIVYNLEFYEGQAGGGRVMSEIKTIDLTEWNEEIIKTKSFLQKSLRKFGREEGGGVWLFTIHFHCRNVKFSAWKYEDNPEGTIFLEWKDDKLLTECLGIYNEDVCAEAKSILGRWVLEIKRSR